MDDQMINVLAGAAAALVPSLLNTFVSSDTWYGKLINALALAFGKARPDPSKQ